MTEHAHDIAKARDNLLAERRAQISLLASGYTSDAASRLAHIQQALAALDDVEGTDERQKALMAPLDERTQDTSSIDHGDERADI
jgi:hypothetical protein